MISKEKGFTFIEIILVLAIVSTIGVLTALLSGNFFFGQGTDIAFETLRSDIREAQLFSMEGRNDSQWGVALRDDSLVFFQGSSYDARMAALDAVYDLPYGVTISGFDEVVAARDTGKVSGTIANLHISGFGKTKNFSFNEEGAFIEE